MVPAPGAWWRFALQAELGSATEMRLGKLTLAFATMAALAAPASAQAPVKVGEINSYKVIPAFLEPYRKGWELAVEEINKSGGIDGRPLEVISRDDNGAPGDAVRAAEELVSREGVVLLTGAFPFACRSSCGRLRQAAEDAVRCLPSRSRTRSSGRSGNTYTFRLRASTYMQTSMLVEDAVKLNKKRWALVYPNYEYGQSAIVSFKKLMTETQPGVEFVVEQARTARPIDAGSVAQAVADAKPDAIFNVTFGADLQKFVREGRRVASSRT